MKTIKTEIHEKPIAATHYRDECNEYEFSWVRFNNNSMFVWDDTYWDEVKDDNFKLSVKPIKTAALENQMNIDNLATQTPEEKEALDLIDTTPHQYEMSKFSGETQWENGDELDWLTPDNKWCMCEHLFIGKHSNGSPVIEHKTTGNMFETYWCAIRKPESPQQREERERLEAAEDLYITYMSKWEFAQDWHALDEINKSAFLAIVDKTNYRKESN